MTTNSPTPRCMRMTCFFGHLVIPTVTPNNGSKWIEADIWAHLASIWVLGPISHCKPWIIPLQTEAWTRLPSVMSLAPHSYYMAWQCSLHSFWSVVWWVEVAIFKPLTKPYIMSIHMCSVLLNTLVPSLKSGPKPMRTSGKPKLRSPLILTAYLGIRNT